MADITGTIGADILIGTPDDDVIDALGGNDQVWAGPGDVGDDIISGGDGNDILGGGPGNDILIGDNHDGVTDLGAPGDDGANTLYGGDGDDLLITGGYSNDGTDATLAGGAGGALSAFITGTGASTAWAGDGNDIIYGAEGDDILGGGEGDDEIYGGAGNDIIYGGTGDGADVLDGGAGDDIIYAGAGDDVINGGAGNDLLFNGAGNDVVDGGDGDDTLWGGEGDDVLTGGAGNDVFGFISGNGNDAVTDFTLGEDVLDLQAFSADFANAAAVVNAMVDTAFGVELTLASGQVVTLEGLSRSDFTSSDAEWVNLTGTPEGLDGDLFTLTESVDFVEVTTPDSFDTVKGVVDGDGDGDTSGSTFTSADTVFGNGNTVLELAVIETGNGAFATLQDLDRIDIVAATSTSVTFNASDWTDVGSVNLDRGVDGLDVTVNNIEASTGAFITNQVGGEIMLNGRDGEYIEVDVDRDSSGGVLDGNILANVADSDNVSISVSDTGDGDISIGSITAAVADNGWFEADIDADNGSVTVGEISVEATGSGSASISIDVDSSGTAQDLTVGDISMVGGVYQYLSLENEGSGDGTRDLTVGNITMSASSVSAYLFNYNSTSTEDSAETLTVGNINMMGLGTSGTFNYLTISQDSHGITGGAMTIGDITAHQAANGDMHVRIYNEGDDVSGGGDAALGATTIGNITMEGDNAADLELSISVDVNGTGAATLGDIMIGAISATVGVNGSIDADLYFEADGSSSSSVGNVTIGDISLMGDDGASIDWTMSISADGATGSIGDVTLGNISLMSGVSGDIDFYNDIEVDNNGSVGAISVGDVMISLGENADGYFTFSVDANTNGDINGGFSVGNLTAVVDTSADLTEFRWDLSADQFNGPISVGDINVSVGENATVSDMDLYVYAVGGDYDTITIGNIMVDVAESGDFSGEITLSGDYGVDAGAAVIGDISLAAATNASATYDIAFYELDDLESLTVGNVDLAALGQGADVSLSITVDASGDVGAFTVGDVTMTVDGGASPTAASDTTAELYLSSDYMNENGGIFVGNVSMDINVGAYEDTPATPSAVAVSNITAAATLDVHNYEGNVTIGDINLSTTSTGTADNDSFVEANVTLTASDEDGDGNAANIMIGDINVTGGDGVVDNFATLTNWLSVSADDEVTVGTIDYSGYGADANIDVTDIDNLTGVIGSANDDTITDDGGVTSSYTGGAGADTFVFQTDNTGLAQGDLDVVQDFDRSEDNLDVGTGALAASEYGEGSHADFDSFVTAADGADLDVYAGAVGTSVFIAVDHDSDNTVDFILELANTDLSGIDLASFI